MPTALTDLIPTFDRELNPTGVEAFVSDIGIGAKIGYIADAFWDAYLSGMLRKYTVVDGPDIGEAVGTLWFTDQETNTEDFPKEYWMLLAIVAGFRVLRLKILNLAVNYKAEAGPTAYEQQASATTLRAVLDSLQNRLNELKALYSDEFTSGFFVLMDGVAQSEYATLNSLPEMQIIP